MDTERERDVRVCVVEKKLGRQSERDWRGRGEIRADAERQVYRGGDKGFVRKLGYNFSSVFKLE